jgi:predicted aspartyl protease
MLRRPILVAVLVAVAATCAPALAQDARCRLQKIVEWQVRSIGRHIAMDGAINGRKIGIVIDTGASSSLLMRASAKRLDLPMSEGHGARIKGIGGDSRLQVAVVDEFRLGDAVVRGMTFGVAGDHDPGEGFDLLLGEDFLSKFDVEFDLAENAVRLWQPKDCGAVSLAYWSSGVVGEVPIKLGLHGRGQIELTVQLNGKPVDAILDSGASTSVVSSQAAAEVGARKGGAAGRLTGMGGNFVNVWVGKFESFAIGNQDFPDVEIGVADHRFPMLIGADFLRAHRALVSHSQGKLYFTYAGGPVFVVGRRSR